MVLFLTRLNMKCNVLSLSSLMSFFIDSSLRTVPAFATAHTFCASWDGQRSSGFGFLNGGAS